MPASKTILSVNSMFEKQAREALSNLEKSPYSDLVAKGNSHWGVVHQDYAFVKKISTLLSKSELRKNMGRKNRVLAEKHYNWDRVAQDVLNVWEKSIEIIL